MANKPRQKNLKLLSAMRNKGFSAKELAKETKHNKNTIYSVISGGRCFAATAEAIAAAVEVPLEELEIDYI